MGQEQSNQVTSETEMPSTNSIADEQLRQQTNLESLDAHGGILEVVKGSDNSEPEEEIRLLQNIATFKPLLTEDTKGFSLDKFLRLQTSTGILPTAALSQTEDSGILNDILIDLQTYISTNSKDINDRQKGLLKRIAYADELTFACFKSMSFGFTQAKMITDKLPEISFIKNQASKAQQQAMHIFQTLSIIEMYLEAEDIIPKVINSEEVSHTKWLPELSNLRARSLQPSSHSMPPTLLERYITSASDIATLSTTTASPPHPQKVVLTPSNQSATVSTHEDPFVEATPAAKRSVSSHSIALDRLRGLSSRSIQQEAHYEPSDESVL